MYQYSLDKSSKKFICPNCHKRTFVKYTEAENNAYVDGDFGRCDRESNCKYHLTPKHNFISSMAMKPIIKPIASTLKKELLAKSLKGFDRNNFIQFLKIYFHEVEINGAIHKYFIGTSAKWNGATVFWQINSQNNIMSGKVMLYDSITGRRIKKPFNHITWVHKILKIEPYTLQQCLFGLHLKSNNAKSLIAIVESEKTAIIMSMFLPEYIWMATGSKGNFKKELLLPIQDYNIVAYPDKSDYFKWNQTAKSLNNNGFKITCSKLIENSSVIDGTDLADLYIEKFKKNFTVPLPNICSPTEIEVKRLAKITQKF